MNTPHHCPNPLLRQFLATYFPKTSSAMFLAVLLLLTGCNDYKQLAVGYQRENLLLECDGEFSNRCSSKKADFNISVLNSTDEIGMLAGDDATRQKLAEALGPEGLRLWKESATAAREHYIARMKALRPGWFARWFLGSSPPRKGSVRMFMDKEDVRPVIEYALAEFNARCTAAGLNDLPVIAGRFLPKSTAVEILPPSSPLAPMTPEQIQAEAASAAAAQATAEALLAAQQAQIAPPTPSSPTSQLAEPQPSEGWQAVQNVIRFNPENYVRHCVAKGIQSAQELGGISPGSTASTDFEPGCRQELADLQHCMTLDVAASEQCYGDRLQDKE